MAAGHPLSARIGADILRDGGNAVDAALAALLAATVCEPLLTGLGAGGYLLVSEPGGPPVLLDFFVEAPGRDPGRGFGGPAGSSPGMPPVPPGRVPPGAVPPGMRPPGRVPPGTVPPGMRPPGRVPPGTVPPGMRPPDMLPVEISFGDAVQIFHIGPASAGTPGLPAGVAAASARFGTIPLADLAAPAVRLAREGVAITRQQAYLVGILHKLVTAYPDCAAVYSPGGRLLTEGDRLRLPELADSLERLGVDGADPFYRGDLAAAIVSCVQAGNEGPGLLGLADLLAYEVQDRQPLVTAYRGHEVVTNPPPSAGGILIAGALARLEESVSPPDAQAIVSAMEFAQVARTASFLEGLNRPGYAEEFLAGVGSDARAAGGGTRAGGRGEGAGRGGGGRDGGGRNGGGRNGGRLGSTTHISVLDQDGRACSVTTSSGACSGVIVPGTGIHLNNMLGEQDLNPLGFHRHPPGRRLPSMMAPTIVFRDGAPRLVLGSAGSNRIRSAILQTIVRVIDQGLHAEAAVDAPRLHLEDGVIYAEPGADLDAGLPSGATVARFSSRNLFFGGVQAAEIDAGGEFHGAGDPRRGGAAYVV